MATSSRSKFVITTTKELEPIKGGAELAIVPYIVPLPTKLVEVFVVVFNIQVEVLEEPIIPKLVPLVLPKIGVGAEVTLIDSVTRAFEVFRFLDTIQKDTHAMERQDLQSIHFVGWTY